MCTIHFCYTQSYVWFVRFLNRFDSISRAQTLFVHLHIHSSMFHTQFTVVVVIVFPPVCNAAAATVAVCICCISARNLITNRMETLDLSLNYMYLLYSSATSHYHIKKYVYMLCISFHLGCLFFMLLLLLLLLLSISLYIYMLFYAMDYDDCAHTIQVAHDARRVPFWRIKASNTLSAYCMVVELCPLVCLPLFQGT